MAKKTTKKRAPRKWKLPKGWTSEIQDETVRIFDPAGNLYGIVTKGDKKEIEAGLPERAARWEATK